MDFFRSTPLRFGSIRRANIGTNVLQGIDRHGMQQGRHF
jgi:hypothetical protein